MKRFSLMVVVAGALLVGCGKKEPPAPKPAAEATNQASSGNPLTAPVDYIGAVGQAQKQSVKVIDTIQVQQAIQQFNAAEGRFPRDFAELVKEGYLVKVPVLPKGMSYQYNPQTGQVRVVRVQ